MNRAQRRQAAKQNAAGFRHAAHATDAGIEKRIREIEKEMKAQARHQFSGLMYCVFILVLRKYLKFGPLRTLRVLHEMAAIINDLEDGVINVFDLKRDAEEAGIQIVFDTDYNIIETGIFEEQKYERVRKKVEKERSDIYSHTSLTGNRLWTHSDWRDEYVTH